MHIYLKQSKKLDCYAMPSPLQLLLDPVSLAVFSLYGALLLIEALFPARPLPRVKYWRLRGLCAFVLYFYVSSYLPLLIGPWLEPFRLLDLTGVHVIAAAAVGVLIYEAGVYLWHRAMHASEFLWRTFHQMHHSAERLDAYGAFWFSPADMVGWTALTTACLTLVGFTPMATTLIVLVTTFLSVFQHANIRTPTWLGYVVQRPESHSIHHGRGVHAFNYSDLPLFDLIGGTFRNPKRPSKKQGFYPGASRRVLEMLLLKDVSRPAAARE